MIRPLRVRHRAGVTALAAILPALLVAGLLARAAIPRSAVPAVLAPPPVDGAPDELAGDAWGGLAIATRTWPATPSRPRAVVELVPAAPLALPDLLLYWTPAAPGERLPADALLLGAFGGSARQRFELPPGAGHGGALVLFSLGHARVAGHARLPER